MGPTGIDPPRPADVFGIPPLCNESQRGVLPLPLSEAFFRAGGQTGSILRRHAGRRHECVWVAQCVDVLNDLWGSKGSSWPATSLPATSRDCTQGILEAVKERGSAPVELTPEGAFRGPQGTVLLVRTLAVSVWI